MKEHRLDTGKNQPSYFFYSIVVISICYLVFQSFFIFYGALAPDEFVFTRHIHDYLSLVPYRDFPPYKTILGYYIFSIPMFFSQSLLGPIFYIKNEIAIINTICILILSFWTIRFFDRKAVLMTLLAIMANLMFMIYSTDLRVDMLTSWACFFAILSVMDKRFRLGGLLLSIAFLISQKAIWYFVAINGAMLICCFALHSSSYRLRTIISFNIAVALPIIIYLAFWSLIAGPTVVLSNIFYEAYVQEGINVYIAGYLICWQAILIRGALLFLIWPMIFLTLFDKTESSKNVEQNIFIICCASIALELFMDYKQPFPYNFVFTVPALFLLYAQFITWLFKQKDKPNSLSIKRDSLSFIFTSIFYLYGIAAVIFFFFLPKINYLILLMAGSLLGYLILFPNRPRLRQMSFALALAIFFLVGVIYPFYRTYLTVNLLDGSYQRNMLQVASSIMGNDGDYVAGIPFFYQKDQPIEGMKNLIEPAISYLEKPNENSKRLLLPSLYLLPSTQAKVLSDFDKYPVKVLIDNYRFDILPKRIKTYINNFYHNFYGSIYLYAPRIIAGNKTINLKFNAKYRVNSPISVNIDGKPIKPGTIVMLTKGQHKSISKKAYRLELVPDNLSPGLVPAFQKNEKLRMMKAIIA